MSDAKTDSHVVAVPLPFDDLDATTIAVESSAVGCTTRGILADLTNRAEHDEFGSDTDAAVARIVSGAAALHAKTGAPIVECLESALIWDVG